MKKIVLALIAAVSLVPAAAVAQSPETWTGMAITETVSPQCANFGADLTDTYDVSLQPQQAQQNPGPWHNGSFIGFYTSGEWFSYALPGNLVPFNTPTIAQLNRVRRSGGSYVHKGMIDRLAINPANFDATTKYITLTMSVADFRGMTGCTVGLRLRLSKVPAEVLNRAPRGVVARSTASSENSK